MIDMQKGSQDNPDDFPKFKEAVENTAYTHWRHDQLKNVRENEEVQPLSENEYEALWFSPETKENRDKHIAEIDQLFRWMWPLLGELLFLKMSAAEFRAIRDTYALTQDWFARNFGFDQRGVQRLDKGVDAGGRAVPLEIAARMRHVMLFTEQHIRGLVRQCQDEDLDRLEIGHMVNFNRSPSQEVPMELPELWYRNVAARVLSQCPWDLEIFYDNDGRKVDKKPRINLNVPILRAD